MTANRPLWVALVSLLLIGGPAMAQDTGVTIEDEASMTLVAKEAGCPDGRTFCFEIEEQPEALSPGDRLNLTLRNDGQTDHTAHVTTGNQSDPMHQDTPASAAVANTTTVEAGGNASINLTVPDGETLYIWCEMTGHEAAGMWLEINLTAQQETNATYGNETNQTYGNETNQTYGNETNQTYGNDTDENQTYGNESNQTYGNESNQTYGNESGDNASGEDGGMSPGDQSAGDDEPLQPSQDPGGGDAGNRSTPTSWVLAVGVVASAAVAVSLLAAGREG